MKKLEYTIKKDHRRISLYGHILERVEKKKKKKPHWNVLKSNCLELK